MPVNLHKNHMEQEPRFERSVDSPVSLEKPPVDSLDHAGDMLTALESEGGDTDATVADFVEDANRAALEDRESGFDDAVAADEVGVLRLLEDDHAEQTAASLGRQPTEPLREALRAVAESRGDDALEDVIEQIERVEREQALSMGEVTEGPVVEVDGSDKMDDAVQRLQTEHGLDGDAATVKKGIRLEKRSIDTAEMAEVPKPAETMPFDMPEANAEGRKDVKSSYEALINAEAREASPDDVYRIAGGIKAGSVEWQMLADAGMSEQRITDSRLTRKELRDAGFFFVNKLGEGEQGIIDGVIVDPDDASVSIDFSGRTLLTKAELDFAYKAQRAEGDPLDGHAVEAVRADSLAFVYSALRPPFRTFKIATETMMPLSPEDPAWQVGTPEERAEAVNYLKAVAATYQAKNPGLNHNWEGIVRQGDGILKVTTGTGVDDRRLNTSHIMTAYGMEHEARGRRKAYSLWGRAEKLQGTPSPFLESGYVFGINPDVTVATKSDELKRINAATIHLMGGHKDYPGLSEYSADAAHDQKYMSTREYVDSIFVSADTKDYSKKSELIEDINVSGAGMREVVAKAQKNFIEMAKTDALRLER